MLAQCDILSTKKVKIVHWRQTEAGSAWPGLFLLERGGKAFSFKAERAYLKTC